MKLIKYKYCKCCGIKIRLSKLPFINTAYEFKENDSMGNYYCYNCMFHKTNEHDKKFHKEKKLKELEK